MNSPNVKPASTLGILAACLIVGVSSAKAASEKAPPPTIKVGGPRIIHGENADINDYPWQVAILVRKSSGTYLCGGSLIAQRRILTAAHCFEPGSRPADVLVKAGATHFLTEGTWTAVEQIALHPLYDARSYQNDIALVVPSALTQGRVIPIADGVLALQEGEPLEITGWGATLEGGPPANQLQKATVPYVDNSECNNANAYAGAVTPQMMCAGHREGGIDSCQGDSGGPLVWNGANGPVLVGIVSFGSGCAKKMRYGVYSRVGAFRTWLSNALTQ